MYMICKMKLIWKCNYEQFFATFLLDLNARNFDLIVPFYNFN